MAGGSRPSGHRMGIRLDTGENTQMRIAQASGKGAKPNGTRASGAKTNGTKTIDANVLLTTLIAFKKGNFAARMPLDRTGVEGKIADALNDILELNQQMVSELDRISQAVGKEGKITQRASIGSA